MSIFIGKSGQSIFDVAFMCYGEYDVLKLIKENSFITDVNYSNFGGKTINYTGSKTNGSYANGLNSQIMNTGSYNASYVITSNKQFQDGLYFEFQDGTTYSFE